MKIPAEVSRLIIDYCQRNIDGLKAVYLFGSQVAGLARKDSDIAVIFSQSLTADTRWELSQG
jgi:predicted nucleotidyltransferase